MSDQGLSTRRDQEPTTRPIDLVTVMGAAITVLGLFSIYIQVVAMAKDNRNLLLGVGVPVNGLSDHHKSMLFLDWIFLWLGASVGAIVFGLLFLCLAWWVRSSRVHGIRLAFPAQLSLWFVGGLFVIAGVIYILTGLLNELPAIQ